MMHRHDRARFFLPAGLLAALLLAAPLLGGSVAQASHGDCGQPSSSGAGPAAGDALVILRVAIGIGTCGDSDSCKCDVDSSGHVTSSDALTVLRAAVGRPVTLDCSGSCTAATTTTTSSTSTSTLDSTTTTQVDPTNPPSPGRKIYNKRCALCHIMGTIDPVGVAPDLQGKGSKLVSDLGTITVLMKGITLTATEQVDLASFLDGLDPIPTDTTTTTEIADPVERGRQIYDGMCGTCHRAGSYDTVGTAPNIAGQTEDLKTNMGLVDKAMKGILLTPDQVPDLAAFLASLGSSGHDDDDDLRF